MLFTDYSFIAFIAIVFAAYYLVPKKTQWMLLLAASYIFYFLCDPVFLIYIMATTVSTFLIGWQINKMIGRQNNYLASHKDDLAKDDKKAYKNAQKSRQRRWLILCLLINFGILAFIKYTDFTIANVNSLLDIFGSDGQLSFLKLAVPMGISFYTFQSMGYIIDIYRGKHDAEKNVFRFALFVSFFPQLVQGPISRYSDLAQTLYQEHSINKKDISFGLQRILWGFFKKLVIADRILVAVNTIIDKDNAYQGAYVFVGMVFYAVQLYADFTGGIDITIGIAEVLGIRIKENFNAPFMARNITDYWRRWHITMGTWFRDYLFYPISVCKPMLNLSRSSRKRLGESLGKRVPVYISTIIVWFATGIWHGSAWNFVVWGLLNGVVIILSQECEPLYAKFHNRFNVKDKTAYHAFEIVRTFLLMSSLRMFDCYRDVTLTFQRFGSMFTTFNFNQLFVAKIVDNGIAGKEILYLGLEIADYIVLAIGLAILIISGIKRSQGGMRAALAAKPPAYAKAIFIGMFLAIIIFGAYGIGFDASQFIYNQF